MIRLVELTSTFEMLVMTKNPLTHGKSVRNAKKRDRSLGGGALNHCASV